MNLSLIGPFRREETHVGGYRRAGLWLTIADVVGLAVGAAAAAAFLLTLVL